MFPCLCGKSFNHSSSLSRHQRGNVKSNVPSCEVFQQYQAEKREANKARFLEARKEGLEDDDRSNTILVHDFNPRMIPDYVSKSDLKPLLPNKGMSMEKRRKLISDSEFGGIILRTVVHYFKEIYMHPDHPENWSVVLQNISSLDLKVRRSGTWIIEPFRDWCKPFVQQFFAEYVLETESTTSHVLGYVLQRLDEDDLWNEVFAAIKQAMTDQYMRVTIKEHHGFR